MEKYLSWENNPLPAHLSIGAVVFDRDSKEILCHHFIKLSERLQRALDFSEELYLLMRETPAPSEGVEFTIKRGLMEEFGADGKIVGYLGSIKSEFEGKGKTIEKTTVYFLVEKTSFNPNKRDPNDEEKDSEIEWHEAGFLIEKMREQQKQLRRTDLDESFILERAKDYLENRF